MNQKNFQKLLLSLLGIFVIGWIYFVVFRHPQNAVISFDEGFHGGISLYLGKVLSAIFDHHSVRALSYIRGEFNNGIIFYPALWTAPAGFMGWLFGPSTGIFRLTTTIFSLLTALLVYCFVRKKVDSQAAAVTVVTLLTMPIFYIYSHLMMLEVPLTFGVALALLGYYWYLTAEKNDSKLILLVALAFIFGVQGKIIGIAVIFGVLILYGLVLTLFWRRDSQWRRFFSWWTLLFVVLAALSWYGYIWLIKHYLHADMLEFFLGQSQGITKSHLGPLGTFLITAGRHIGFYFNDFVHYPIVSLVWFGSLLGLVVWKRTSLAAFLFCYALGAWIVFSGVTPQVVQYVMPIVVPLAIATGIMVSELTKLVRSVKLSQAVLVLSLIILVLLQSLSIKSSETQGWRYNISYQEAIAEYIAGHAKQGDRVITWNDGTSYALRLAGYSKQLQLYNGNSGVCSKALDLSGDWAVIEPGSDQADHIALLNKANWHQVKQYGPSKNATYVFHNEASGKTTVSIEAETLAVSGYTVQEDLAASGHKAILMNLFGTSTDFNVWGCYRLLSLGEQTIKFRLKTEGIAIILSDPSPIVELEIAQVSGPSITRAVTLQEIKSPGYQDIALKLNNTRIDSMYGFKVRVEAPASVALDTITIQK